MGLPDVRMTVLRIVATATFFWLFLAEIMLPGPLCQAQELSGKGIRASDENRTGPRRPMSAETARTWIALSETKVRPLPDRTPLRQVLQALRDATRGKAGLTQGVDFRVVPEALLEAETTLDAPVALPFVGRPEVSVDMYLKYLLRQFVWERYVVEGSVVIDSPFDDCAGYETVRAAEAYTWLLLHENVQLELARRASLGEFLSAITIATRGKGQDGRGLMIYPKPSALRAKAVSWHSSVEIKFRRAEVGDLLRTTLKQLDLAIRVLPDGTTMLTEAGKSENERASDDAFPEYRFSYEFVWNQWVEALEGAARTGRPQTELRKSTPPRERYKSKR
jgi:hypothetical protein